MGKAEFFSLGSDTVIVLVRSNYDMLEVTNILVLKNIGQTIIAITLLFKSNPCRSRDKVWESNSQ